MKRRVIGFFGMLAVAVLVQGAAPPAPGARPLPTATVLSETPLPGDAKRKVVVIGVVLPPNADSHRHTHPGDQYTVVNQGQLILTIDGQKPRLIKTGETFHIERGVIHRNENASKTQPARTTEFFIIDKDGDRTTRLD